MTRELPGGDDISGGPPDDGDRQVVVAAEPFAQFIAWMDRELDKLVARWSHLAAPNAGQSRRQIPRQPKQTKG